MKDSVSDICDAASLLPLLGNSIAPKDLLEQHPHIRGWLSQCKRKETTLAFASLLLDETLQSNCVRLEALVHLAVACCDGEEILTSAAIVACFNDLGNGVCGRMEDPAEDVFAAIAMTPAGNYRVLEGIWESGTFFLQRLLDVVETWPEERPFSYIRKQVYSLLRLSEALCGRAGIGKYTVGGETPLVGLTLSDIGFVDPRVLCFSDQDLAGIGISRDDLKIFTCSCDSLSYVPEQPIEMSPLQRFPIIDYGDEIALVMPTAVSCAIRLATLEYVCRHNLTSVFVKVMAQSYASLFRMPDFLGSINGTHAPIFFSYKDTLPCAEFMTEADTGRYLHVVLFVDTLNGFLETGLMGVDSVPGDNIELLCDRIEAARTHAHSQPHFRSGITLLIHCGIGRGMFLPLPEDTADWRVECLSAPDAYTLSFTDRFKATSLWRLREGLTQLACLGVDIDTFTGLLNLVGWILSNDFNLVDHSQVPKEVRRKGKMHLVLAPSFVLKMRREALVKSERLRIPTVSGVAVTVRRMNESFFPEDRDSPIYTTEYYSKDNGIPFVYLSDNRVWWCEVIPNATDTGGDYDRWLMLRTWMRRIVPRIEPCLDKKLPNVVLLRVVFAEIPPMQAEGDVPTLQSITSAISTSVDVSVATAILNVGEAFHRGLASPINISERALAMAICDAFARLAGIKWSPAERGSIEAAVVCNDEIRQLHHFRANQFRDYVRNDVHHELITIDDMDIANLRLGMAFRVEPRDTGRLSLRSKRQCTRLLNALVRDLEEELRSTLRQYDRRSVVELAFQNHERAAMDRRRWETTASANMAAYRDKDETARIISEHSLKYDTTTHICRVLVEIALCECPLSNALHICRYELSQLLAKLHVITTLGGWSDAIHLDAMPPTLAISPLGDVQADTSYESNVLMPFIKHVGRNRINWAVQDYGENFVAPEAAGAMEPKLDQDFIRAWNAEFGFSIDDVLRCIDAVEELAIRCHKAILVIRRNELLAALTQHYPCKEAANIINALSLVPRKSWREIPPDCVEKDIQPWRYRRQLSTVRRPIIQLNRMRDPLLVIAPGMLRESIRYIVSSYHDGAFPDRHYRSTLMKKWSGKQASVRGPRFAKQVSDYMRQYGWNTLLEAQVTKLLERGFDTDYGDVDVCAWNDSGRVLIIECKYLQYHKTPGEIAEQLNDYRGRVKNNGKRDDLRKHLDRIEILNRYKCELANMLKCHHDIAIEGWIVFRNPVPMLYMWNKLQEHVKVATFDDLGAILPSAR